MRVQVIWVLILVACPLHAEDGVTLGYITGNDYLAMPESGRIAWLVGAFDGLMAESVAVAKDPKGPWLGRCLKGIPANQAVAMFDKYLRDNPSSWHAPAAFMLRDSMVAFCKRRS
jgi:hypothetical protein